MKKRIQAKHWQRGGAIALILLFIVIAWARITPGDDGPQRRNVMFSYGYSSVPPPFERVCDDSIDNDADSLVDCEDFQDCALAASCEEICDNEIDDDDDGAVDCDDLWCQEYDPDC
jgi:hypothetical protein